MNSASQENRASPEVFYPFREIRPSKDKYELLGGAGKALNFLECSVEVLNSLEGFDFSDRTNGKKALFLDFFKSQKPIFLKKEK
ncbi:MAG: hypothetical protein ABIG37_02100 [Nanoarchaeota archaeon]|nr:hypothetical protein [Nanoarchaeota archaeon]